VAAFWLKAAAVGLFSGILSGMFGIGGGILTTPAIRLLLGGSAIAAVASSLPPIILTSLTGAYSYTRDGIADARSGAQLGGWGAAFAVLGAYLTRFIGGSALLVATAVIIVYMAGDMVLLAMRREPEPQAPPPPLAEAESMLACDGPACPRFRTTPLALAIVGSVTGLYSGLLGLGGGFIIVPVLSRWFGFSAKQAVGTSLVAISVLAVPATVTHALLGHIDWRIAAALSLTTVPGALIGARVTKAASDRAVRIGFAVLLVVAAGVLFANELLEVRRLPVINKSKRMVGMLALGDASDLAPSDLLSEYVKRVSAHH
jgi:uncharacterized membrane protein YfcA